MIIIQEQYDKHLIIVLKREAKKWIVNVHTCV